MEIKYDVGDLTLEQIVVAGPGWCLDHRKWIPVFLSLYSELHHSQWWKFEVVCWMLVLMNYSGTDSPSQPGNSYQSCPLHTEPDSNYPWSVVYRAYQQSWPLAVRPRRPRVVGEAAANLLQHIARGILLVIKDSSCWGGEVIGTNDVSNSTVG